MTTGPASADVAVLFDQLCLRWAREADVVVHEQGRLPTTLVLLPRDMSADEVAIRVDGLRGNLAERAEAIVAELRPQTTPHDPAGLVFMTELRLAAESGPVAHLDNGNGHHGHGYDGVAVYVSLGAPGLRRALAYRIEHRPEGTASLRREDDDPPLEAFSWLDALLRPA